MNTATMGKMAFCVAVAGLAAIGLAGCGSGSDRAYPNAMAYPSSVTYTAWAENGTISEVTYYLIHGMDGAMQLSDNPESETWALSVDGGSAPSLTVVPEPGAAAHCIISSPSTERITAITHGEPGQTITCATREVRQSE
ncbi:hypothetical protein IT072_02995 [Leifsonia sp. ZF2019]|uniref:hypothetical protein n=1 Tax=Leifsonia sp. ZF2019 TaxID=2781978 RepID=UPI001CBC0B2D|nr:hypothetical protein [Leifsonia sp. ZF2019]UAJ80056.1 hypothetical protein IT072_02995 [Leifsonia sp. ZF2019]